MAGMHAPIINYSININVYAFLWPHCIVNIPKSIAHLFLPMSPHYGFVQSEGPGSCIRQLKEYKLQFIILV